MSVEGIAYTYVFGVWANMLVCRYVLTYIYIYIYIFIYIYIQRICVCAFDL
jgi:hypothetical protein